MKEALAARSVVAVGCVTVYVRVSRCDRGGGKGRGDCGGGSGMDERPLGGGHGFYVEAEKGEDHGESEGQTCPAHELALVRELVLGEDSAHSVGEGGLDFC